MNTPSTVVITRKVMKLRSATSGQTAAAAATASGPCSARRPPSSARTSSARSPAALPMRMKSASFVPELTTM